MLVKGILHPGDARRVFGLGLDGIVVSNHGRTPAGRQCGCPGRGDGSTVIENLVAELDVIMALTGVERVADIGRDHVLDVAEH